MLVDGLRRTVALVVGGLAAAFLAVLLAVQFGGGEAASIVTLPLVLAVPALAAGLYWYVRER